MSKQETKFEVLERATKCWVVIATNLSQSDAAKLASVKGRFSQPVTSPAICLVEEDAIDAIIIDELTVPQTMYQFAIARIVS